jgi:hypothetical protein
MVSDLFGTACLIRAKGVEHKPGLNRHGVLTIGATQSMPQRHRAGLGQTGKRENIWSVWRVNQPVQQMRLTI